MSYEMAMSFVSISIAIVSISKQQLSIIFVRSFSRSVSNQLFLNAGEEIHKLRKLDKLSLASLLVLIMMIFTGGVKFLY